MPLLLGLLSRSEGARTMVFVNTKAWVERVARALERGGYRVGVLQRRRAAEEARVAAGQVPEGPARDPGGHRRRRARPAHRRRLARLQLRPAVRCRGLRPPHRPHRAPGRRGRRDQLRLRALRDVPAGHRGLHRAEAAARERSSPTCWCRCRASRAKCRKAARRSRRKASVRSSRKRASRRPPTRSAVAAAVAGPAAAPAAPAAAAAKAVRAANVRAAHRRRRARRCANADAAAAPRAPRPPRADRPSRRGRGECRWPCGRGRARAAQAASPSRRPPHRRRGRRAPAASANHGGHTPHARARPRRSRRTGRRPGPAQRRRGRSEAGPARPHRPRPEVAGHARAAFAALRSGGHERSAGVTRQADWAGSAGSARFAA